jgi:hypothetical protein
MNRWLFQIAPKTGLTAGIVCILCSAICGGVTIAQENT